jgi:acetoin utilization deacetylase AcuC-like enzyme
MTDRRIGFSFHPAFLQHQTGSQHPEHPNRLRAICEHLASTGLWTRLIPLTPPRASHEAIGLVHPPAYIDHIRRACEQGPIALDPDTIASPGSWDAALRAAGAATDAVDRLMRGELHSAFCAVRPPGHHALADQAMGFCLFNNIAIAARYAQQRHRLSRVLIVDWDVHHGNGTEAVFEDDPSVLYFSTHQFPFYPGTGRGSSRGSGAGAGFTINVPLPSGSGDEEAHAAFTGQLLPRAAAFKPELVLISAGFDAHQDDPLAGLAWTESGYAALTKLVRQVADATAGGRIVSMLEGGYNLESLGSSVDAHLLALLE